MNWKSTAVVSGVTLIATWFASAPPSSPAPERAVERTAAATSGVSHADAEIVREADRLSARLHPRVEYQEPERNPFRFGAVRPATVPSARRSAPVAPQVTNEMPAAPTLRVNLSGIAEDAVAGNVVRTAVISTPDDVLLVKEGEMIAGQYKVTAITANSVELTRVSDGSVIRLTLRP